MNSFAVVFRRHVGFLLAGVVFVYCLIHAFDPPRLNWGDSGSDYNVMEAGKNFHRYGFLRLHLTPHLLDPQLITNGERSLIYTHYPQLPDLMNGVERAAGLTTLPQFRLVSLAFAFASLFFLYRLIALYWSRETGQFALALWVVNPLWIQHADYLHHIPYLLFFGLGSLYFLERYLREGLRTRYLIASGVFLFLTYCSSYDYWFFAPILIAAATIGHFRAMRGPTVRVLAALGAFAVAAVAFKVATNVWGQGGWASFLSDLHFQFAERATSKVTGVSPGAAAWPTFAGRVERCFSLLAYPIAIFWAVLPLARGRLVARWPALASLGPNPWVLFSAAVPFLWLFREMWIGQLYPAMLVLPFFVVAAGALIRLCLAHERRLLRGVGYALFAGLVLNSVVENASLERAFMPTRSIDQLRADLDRVSTPGQYLLTNHIFDGLYRYYFERNIVLMILNRPERIPAAVTYYTDPRNVRIVGPGGAIYVQHKHIENQLYDKGIYYILADNAAWSAWANPEKYHAAINALVRERDSLLTAAIAPRSQRLAETSDYVIWRILPDSRGAPLKQ